MLVTTTNITTVSSSRIRLIPKFKFPTDKNSLGLKVITFWLIERSNNIRIESKVDSPIAKIEIKLDNLTILPKKGLKIKNKITKDIKGEKNIVQRS
tara:strand:+ start:1056 stop:1343 length:288 start_codon:yes stop_codon:yes gene_type:complete